MISIFELLLIEKITAVLVSDLYTALATALDEVHSDITIIVLLVLRVVLADDGLFWHTKLVAEADQD